jgi:hypothetical protein
MKQLCSKCGVVLVAVMLFTSVSVMAQEQESIGGSALSPKIGVRGGINLSNMFVDDVSDENMKLGVNVGVFAKLPLTRGFSIQPELNYSSKGAKQNYNNFIQGEGEYRFNLNYVELPVLAVFNLGENFNIHAGPYIAYLASVNIKDLNDDGTIDKIADLNAENFNRIDYGLSGGIGVDVGNFGFGARYNYGLREIGKSGSLSGELTKNSRNSAISLYIALGF